MLAAVRGVLRREVIDGRPNPAHIALARRGYWIQSQRLHIPDRFGFFSPSTGCPPRLQAHQGATFTFLAASTVGIIIYGGLTLMVVGRAGRPVLRLAAFMAAFQVGMLGLAWAVVCYERHRTPSDNWKLRRE